MSSAAAELELLPQGNAGAAHTVAQPGAICHFGGIFLPGDAVWEWESSGSCGLCRGGGESSPGGQFESWGNIFY